MQINRSSTGVPQCHSATMSLRHTTYHVGEWRDPRSVSFAAAPAPHPPQSHPPQPPCHRHCPLLVLAALPGQPPWQLAWRRRPRHRCRVVPRACGHRSPCRLQRPAEPSCGAWLLLLPCRWHLPYRQRRRSRRPQPCPAWQLPTVCCGRWVSAPAAHRRGCGGCRFLLPASWQPRRWRAPWPCRDCRCGSCCDRCRRRPSCCRQLCCLLLAGCCGCAAACCCAAALPPPRRIRCPPHRCCLLPAAPARAVPELGQSTHTRQLL